MWVVVSIVNIVQSILKVDYHFIKEVAWLICASYVSIEGQLANIQTKG